MSWGGSVGAFSHCLLSTKGDVLAITLLSLTKSATRAESLCAYR